MRSKPLISKFLTLAALSLLAICLCATYALAERGRGRAEAQAPLTPGAVIAAPRGKPDHDRRRRWRSRAVSEAIRARSTDALGVEGIVDGARLDNSAATRSRGIMRDARTNARAVSRKVPSTRGR
ncbi:MAG: hypothetical protein KDD44_03675 [Bdellovibrionales bacterium]|nr:hypothetical protein [Bdellovibrionales bacterium]